MRKIHFTGEVLPHLIAVVFFLLVTVVLFNPVIFDNKVLNQHDINEWEGSSKSLRDYRAATGEEGLWTNAMFSGMPAYLIHVEWGNQPIGWVKKIISLTLPHPIANIFLGFVSYYLMLLAFGIRPWLSMTGAVGFGLSSYLIIGLVAGHSARIGAIAFLPAVVGGVHLLFTRRYLTGFALTLLAFAMHLRENHVQITYYLAFILVGYGIMQLVVHLREKKLKEFLVASGLTIPAMLLAIGTFVGPLWAVNEYSQVTIRGKSDLQIAGEASQEGLSKDRAFDYSSGKTESLMLLIPNAVGGSTGNFLVMDRQSKTYKALVNSGNQEMANQLANYTSSYWGPQRYTSPYYGSAILIFLAVIGIALAPRQYTAWLVPLAILGIVLSWGKNFETFNYWLFDHLPAYNKFRSVTFALVITLFAIPLLAMLGMERYFSEAKPQIFQKRILLSGGILTGLLLLFALLPDVFFAFAKPEESELPDWFLSALISDRRGLFQADAWRSLLLIAPFFLVLYFNLGRFIPQFVLMAGFVVLVWFDQGAVDSRYLTKDNYERKKLRKALQPTEADKVILRDTAYYRVMNLNLGEVFNEARTSYFHQSVGGYHGAKIRRYEELFDSCMVESTRNLIEGLQTGTPDFTRQHILNMLNIKYYVYGPEAGNIIPNPESFGPAWFVSSVSRVKSANEELATIKTTNLKTTAVIDESLFSIPEVQPDSAAMLQLVSHSPNRMVYTTNRSTSGVAVFSEIYYAQGWKAFVDNQEVPILRANYVLRAVAVPPGKHQVEFRFEPKAWTVGNRVTAICSWSVILLSLAGFGLAIYKR